MTTANLQQAQERLQRAQIAEQERITRETAGQREIDAAQAQIADLERAALLVRYREKLADLHALYTRRVELDAALRQHQDSLEALEKEMSHLKTDSTTESNRRGKLLAEALKMGIPQTELEAIWREFAPIKGYW